MILFQSSKSLFVKFKRLVSTGISDQRQKVHLIKNNNNYFIFLLENRAVVLNTRKKIHLSLSRLLLGT